MNGEGENGSKEDMNSMNHSTLSSLLRSTYDPQHSTDPDNMYVHMYVCMYVCTEYYVLLVIGVDKYQIQCSAFFK